MPFIGFLIEPAAYVLQSKYVKLLHSLFTLAETFREKVKINPYIFTVLILGLALLLEFFLNYLIKQDIYGLLVIAAFLSAWYGGFFPGVLATVIGLFLADYFFINPKYKILQTLPEIVRVIIFFVQGLLFSLLSESRKTKEQEKEGAYIAEQKARKMAQDATNQRDEFISMAFHELKSPITSQKAFLQIAQSLARKKDDSEIAKYLQKIESQTDKLTSLINQLLDIAKIRAGKMEQNYSHFDLKECIALIVEELNASSTIHQIITQGEIRESIYADKERISQVIMNLLSNAIKYSPKAKKVLVILAENKKYISISIKDYGIGISRENQKQLFSKYFRVEGISEKHFKGFGMGLFIVSEIVKQHNGKIWAKSTKGKGSTFTFTLPKDKTRAN